MLTHNSGSFDDGIGTFGPSGDHKHTFKGMGHPSQWVYALLDKLASKVSKEFSSSDFMSSHEIALKKPLNLDDDLVSIVVLGLGLLDTVKMLIRDSEIACPIIDATRMTHASLLRRLRRLKTLDSSRKYIVEKRFCERSVEL